MRLSIPFVMIAALLPDVGIAQPESRTFLCITEHSNGFGVSGSTGKWEHTRFTTGDRYLVRPLRAEDDLYGIYKESDDVVPYGIFSFGETKPTTICGDGFSVKFGDAVIETEFMRCRGLSQFVISAENMRFTIVYWSGWHTQGPGNPQKGGDTPSISLGSCTPL